MPRRPMRYRVTKEHKPDDHEPLVFRKGERLEYERRPTEWKGWVWCVSRTGRSGWVPEAWLSLKEDRCVALRDYESTELSVAVGEEVFADRDVSGWVWARNERGGAGWVPTACLNKV